ncbi:MAG TPA: helix-turn-helix transcriptional regulator [Candidatus Ruminococcus avistercoris]|nr:helix-turn-helix transcriptional regulator [Candidatus Ruminococcus avistercoris]
MIINELMKNKKLTRYRLAKDSGIAYTTINDICSGKARLEKCSAETIYRISKVLGVSMESLIEPCFDKRIDFELFKSNTCHKLKELGDVEFVIELLEEDRIRKYYKKKWYPESLYLLAMLDYVSRENDIPICTQYDDLRKVKLKNILFPASILAAARVAKNDEIKRRSVREAIPEFMRFNIVESEVRNVV